MLILHSSEPKGACYIETKNLDGETNLKHKMACKETVKIFADEKQVYFIFQIIFFSPFKKIGKQAFTLSYEKPNPYLYTFCGTAIFPHQKVSCDAQNFVLRGCSLRNTEYIIGLIAYSG